MIMSNRMIFYDGIEIQPLWVLQAVACIAKLRLI